VGGDQREGHLVHAKKGEDTLYAVVKEKERWKRGDWKELVLRSVEATPQTEVSVLGQNDKVYEYRPDVVPKPTWKQEPDGLHVRAMFAQRLVDNSRWPNPVVVKITHVKPALTLPRVETSRAVWNAAAGTATPEGNLRDLGQSVSLEVGFEYRDITGLDTNERTGAWTVTPLARRDAAGGFAAQVGGLKPGNTYEYRAVVKHPLLTLYGLEKRFTVQ
jgi:alpha-L-fucosidase